MLLSIGMIVKNEEQYLERCLTALGPVLEQLESELIIGDTGSEDSTLEIARRFTENVFRIQWKGDYAQARNEVLKRAKGEWYMSLDGDEIFTDVSEIIEFFRSGEYRDYNAGTYVIRSFNDHAETAYSDFNAGRMVQMTENTAYEGRIHEQLFPFLEPVKYFKTIVKHYGYLTDGAEMWAAHEKSQRNIRLLEKELKRRPADPLLHCQMGDALRLGDNNAEALKSYDNAIRYSRIRDLNDIHVLHCAYKSKASLLVSMGEWQGVIDTVDRYFGSVKKNHDCTDVDMDLWRADALYAQRRFAEAAEALEVYLEDCRMLEDGEFDGRKLMLSPVATNRREIRRRSEIRLAECRLKTGELEKARETLDNMWPWIKDDSRGAEQYAELSLSYMEESGEYSGLSALYLGLGQDCLDIFRTQVERYLKEKQKKKEEDRESALLEAFSQIGRQDAWCMVKGMDFRLKFRSQPPAREDVETLIREAGRAGDQYGAILYYGLLAGTGAGELAGYIPPERVKEYYSFCCERYQDMPEVVYRSMESYSGEADSYANLWLAFLYGSELAASTRPLWETQRLFRHYTVHFYQYLAKVYREEVFMEDNLRLLPQEHRAGCCCCLAQLCQEDGMHAGYVKYLRLALEADRGLKGAVQTLIGGIAKG